MPDFLPADPQLRGQLERRVTELGRAYALVRWFGDMDAPRVGEFVCTLLKAGASDQIDALLEHLDVSVGAWRELADQADRVIEGVAAALTRAVLERAAGVEAGGA